METFIYKALKNGKVISGEVKANSEYEVEGKLKEKNLEIISISNLQDKKKSSDLKHFNIPFFKKKIKKSEKVFLFKNFYTMLKAGLPVLEIIDLLRESVKNSKLIEILEELKFDIETGNYISSSLLKHSDVFGKNEISMIKAGEAGGTLPQSFEGLYKDAESELKLIKNIKSAMMYPAIILSILLLVTLLLLLFVLPQFTSFFTEANMEVPQMTKIVMGFSVFIRKYCLLVIALGLIFIVGINFLFRNSRFFRVIIENIIIRIPIVGTQVKYYYIHKISRILGSLLKSGVPILQALDIVNESVSNNLYSRSVKSMKDKVKSGGQLSEAIEKFGLIYPPFVSRMLKVGDRTGNTADSLDHVSEYYKEELQETLDNLSSLIEPILMVLLGIGVAFIAISILIPLYKMVSGINQIQQK